jgi:hypothetical protein
VKFDSSLFITEQPVKNQASRVFNMGKIGSGLYSTHMVKFLFYFFFNSKAVETEYLNKQKEESSNLIRMQISKKCTVYSMCTVLKSLKGGISQSHGRLSESGTLRSDGSRDSQTGGWTS